MEERKHASRLSAHVKERMTQRSISSAAIDAAMHYGRTLHIRGACVHVIGKREISQAAARKIDLASYEGVHVVSVDHRIITTYRNRNLNNLRRPGGLNRRRRRRRSIL